MGQGTEQFFTSSQDKSNDRTKPNIRKIFPILDLRICQKYTVGKELNPILNFNF